MIHFKVNFRDLIVLLIAIISVWVSVWLTHQMGKQHGSSMHKYIPTGSYGEKKLLEE